MGEPGFPSGGAVRRMSLAAAAFAALFAVMAVGVVLAPRAWPIDVWANDAVLGLRSLVLDRASLALAAIGDTAGMSGVTLASVLLLLAARRRREGVFVAVNVASGVAASTLVKSLVARPRPVAPHLGAPLASASFPSGHVVAAVCFAGAIAVLIALAPRASRAAKVAAAVAASAWVGSMAASRVYLGVHYLSDVVGGVLLGASVVAASSAAFAVRAGDAPARHRRLTPPAA
ncbi:MAG: phosphatase PAP2 family protein [Coriobacteriia bacterium]|nr:phosphatase PAP2 family protein [Coriobacteriia bacterium]